MPIGPYKNWGECVSAQKRKGYSDDVANKICGKIESNVRKSQEKKHKKKK